MGKRLGQTIFIENRTGAAGTIGTQQVAVAAADGYTITIGGMTTHVAGAGRISQPALRSDQGFHHHRTHRNVIDPAGGDQ